MSFCYIGSVLSYLYYSQFKLAHEVFVNIIVKKLPKDDHATGLAILHAAETPHDRLALDDMPELEDADEHISLCSDEEEGNRVLASSTNHSASPSKSGKSRTAASTAPPSPTTIAFSRMGDVAAKARNAAVLFKPVVSSRPVSPSKKSPVKKATGVRLPDVADGPLNIGLEAFTGYDVGCTTRAVSSPPPEVSLRFFCSLTSLTFVDVSQQLGPSFRLACSDHSHPSCWFYQRLAPERGNRCACRRGRWCQTRQCVLDRR